jgi:hypothetical protein
VEYWGGFFRHLHHPQYSFEVPDGWRLATVSDYLSLSSSQRVFQTLDEVGRRAFIQRAELAMKSGDTVLISPRGAWIQVKSDRSLAAGIDELNRYGLSEREKQPIWRRFSTDLIQRAPPADQLKLSLEGMEVETYGENRFLRLRFRSDATTTGSMHWTVLNFYGSLYIVTVAHLGTPEDIEEGIVGLEVIARSFRFE